MLSFIEVARGIRKPTWFFSEQYIELLKKNYEKFFTNFNDKINLKLSGVDDWYSLHITSLDSLMNFFYVLSKNSGLTNLRWTSFISVNQKYYKMFLGSSTQQRLLANW
jgi:hypothetical protein